jgi:hypothetical protein
VEEVEIFLRKAKNELQCSCSMRERILAALLLITSLSQTLSTMVEHKDSLYGSENVPLLVPTAPPEQQEDVLRVEPETPNESENLEHDRMVSAGVASGVLGLLLGGPFLALLMGFGTAYAVDKDGAAGDAARAVGDVALLAKRKAIEVDAKHSLVEKSKVVANDAWERCKEVDRKHNVLEKTKGFVVFTWGKMLEINREHRVLERAVEAIGKGMAYLFTQISNKLNPRDDTSSSDTWTEVPTVVNERDCEAK